MRTALRDALQGDRGEEGGTVPAPPRPRVEEDNSEASGALQRGSDQGRRDLRLAEAQDQDFVPGDSSTSDSDSDSDSGSSNGSASGEGARTDPQASQSSATPSGGSRNLSPASASQRDPSPARSTISVSSSSSRARRPRPKPLSAPPPPPPPPPALPPSRRLAPVTLSFQLAMSSSPLSVASSVPSSPSFRDGWGDLPELLRFGDEPASPLWDSNAEKCLSELASPQPPLPTPPPSPPPPRRAPTSPSPLPRPHSTPYQVALEVWRRP